MSISDASLGYKSLLPYCEAMHGQNLQADTCTSETYENVTSQDGSDCAGKVDPNALIVIAVDTNVGDQLQI